MAGTSKPIEKSNCNEEFNDESNTITMLDVLEEEEKMEEDAKAVLGASDDKNCTYNQGYMKRQALYACMTCLRNTKKLAGVCLACSYHCHEGHDLAELYTKRNFRCDCGNGQFGDKKCNLEPNKTETNSLNIYNQNFRELYCNCSRPYPDPDDSNIDGMIQCIVCEDWYHLRHLDCAVPNSDDFSEMICGGCTDRLSFLHHYLGLAVTKLSETADTAEAIKMDNSTSTNEDSTSNVLKREDSLKDDLTNETTNDSQNTEPKICEASGLTKASSNKTVESVSVSDHSGCLLSAQKPLERSGKGATFWATNFRTQLCTCDLCQEMYKSEDVSWLTDPSDTVQAYEEAGLGQPQTQYELGLKALAQLDRTKQVEAMHQYNEMKMHLNEYLSKFAESKKVVREEDIREFFSGMAARKRQKVEMPQHFCR